jgi:hypothetical protein
MRGLIALALAGLTAVSAAAALASSTVVIRVKSVQTVGRITHNEPPAGLSKGDVILERDKLFNVVRQFGKPAGALVGSDHATITLVTATTATVSGTAVFPDGTITFKGTTHVISAAPTPIPIVGGTGRYKHAHGAISESGGDPSNARNTYKVTLP